jgi:hypothetical protein
MYGSELRTCALGAVVAVLPGAGIGFGWHYLDDGGARASIAATPLAQHDAPSPSPSAPPPQGGPVLDVPRLPVLSRPNNQPDTTHARGALKITQALHGNRARQVLPPFRPDGGERRAF